MNRNQFIRELSRLLSDVGFSHCLVAFPLRMSERHQEDPRSYAEVDVDEETFYFAPEVLNLPEEHQRGLMMHEIGHLLCRDLPGGGTEHDADNAAYMAFGKPIRYDCRWPGKGLQRVANPPYSGYDKTYYEKALPRDPTKIAYQRKRDALNLFLDWNADIVDGVFRGPSFRHDYAAFDNINHRFGLKGKRRVDTLAKAAWWALLPRNAPPYYLEDINLHLLNDTDIAQRAEVAFTLPDYQEERRLAEQEFAYWEEKYGGVFPDEEDLYVAPEDEVPF